MLRALSMHPCTMFPAARWATCPRRPSPAWFTPCRERLPRRRTRPSSCPCSRCVVLPSPPPPLPSRSHAAALVSPSCVRAFRSRLDRRRDVRFRPGAGLPPQQLRARRSGFEVPRVPRWRVAGVGQGGNAGDRRGWLGLRDPHVPSEQCPESGRARGAFLARGGEEGVGRILRFSLSEWGARFYGLSVSLLRRAPRVAIRPGRTRGRVRGRKVKTALGLGGWRDGAGD